MNIRVDKLTKDQLDEWRVTASLAARKCVRRYNRKPWRIKPRKRKETAILQDIPEDLGHEPWKIEAIIEDCVDMDLKNYVKPTPITLEVK
jgi:hypothetical protein